MAAGPGQGPEMASARGVKALQLVDGFAVAAPQHLLDDADLFRKPVGEGQRANAALVDLALEGDGLVGARWHLDLLLAQEVGALARLAGAVEVDPPRLAFF